MIPIHMQVHVLAQRKSRAGSLLTLHVDLLSPFFRTYIYNMYITYIIHVYSNMHLIFSLSLPLSPPPPLSLYLPLPLYTSQLPVLPTPALIMAPVTTLHLEVMSVTVTLVPMAATATYPAMLNALLRVSATAMGVVSVR